jgi:cobalt-zinc-cadmium efflux system outer membrane protein
MRKSPPGSVLLACLVLCIPLASTIWGADLASGKAADIPTEPAARLPAVLGLAELEQLAFQRNPTLVQAAANVDVAKGRQLQSGLYPNPTVGYSGEQIGLRGKAAPGEQQGMFIDQTIVTAGKLRLNRARDAQEMAQAEFQVQAQQFRVVNGVRTRFYQLLAMQRLLGVRAELLQVAEDAVTTTEELVNVGAANRADLLQARIEARQEKVAQENSRTLYEAVWKQLAAFVGEPCLPPVRLQGNLEDATKLPDFEITLAHLLEASPEVQIARSDVARGQFALKREQVEPIPNINVRVSTGYDFESRTETTSVQIGARLPLFDKNEGNIRAARADLMRAQAETARVELSLRQRLARQYARYKTALATVESYRKGNLPDAKEAYELYLESFRKRRAAWPQVLVAQRTYFQISVDYVEALNDLHRAEVAILGLLLVDDLDEPMSPRRGRGQENHTGNSSGGPGG